MAPTFHELKHMTVAEMRDLASENEHEALQGYSQMRKEQLLLRLRPNQLRRPPRCLQPQPGWMWSCKA